MVLNDWKKMKETNDLIVFVSKEGVKYTTADIYPKFKEYNNRPIKELWIKREVKSVINGLEYGWDVFLFREGSDGREINKTFKSKSEALKFAIDYMNKTIKVKSYKRVM